MIVLLLAFLAEPKGSYFHELFSANNLPNDGLFIVGLAGTILALITLSTIVRQTKAAEDAASAALKNAQAVINSERAWVVVSAESHAPNQFRYIATNAGKTPARITSIWCNPIVTPRGAEVVVPLDAETGESHLSTPPQLLPPSASITVRMFDLSGVAQRSEIERGFSSLHFYGRIVYYDTLEPFPQEPRETKWLYWHVPIDGSMPFPDPHHQKHNFYS